MALISLDGQDYMWYRSDDKGMSWKVTTPPCTGVTLSEPGAAEEFRTAMGAARDGNVLWAICAQEPANRQGKAAVISLDGGRTWKSLGPLESAGHSYFVQPIDARIAWRIGFNVEYVVMRTEDARTWTAVTPPSEANILQLVAVDGDTAIVLNAGTVFITKDGGRTWSTSSLPRMPSPG